MQYLLTSFYQEEISQINVSLNYQNLVIAINSLNGKKKIFFKIVKIVPEQLAEYPGINKKLKLIYSSSSGNKYL